MALVPQPASRGLCTLAGAGPTLAHTARAEQGTAQPTLCPAVPACLVSPGDPTKPAQGTPSFPTPWVTHRSLSSNPCQCPRQGQPAAPTAVPALDEEAQGFHEFECHHHIQEARYLSPTRAACTASTLPVISLPMPGTKTHHVS